MPRYLAKRTTWLSHSCVLVKEGEEFETTFPEGMKLGDNLEQLPDEKKGDKKADKKPAGDLV